VVKDCLSDQIKHIDLIEIDEKGDITVPVAVIPDARNCPGIKAGGIVEQRQRTIKVRCKANAIPDSLSVNLDEVQLTDVVLVEKVQLPPGVTLVTSGKSPLLSVVIPRGLKITEEVKAAEPGTAAAAPADGAAPAAGAEAGKPAAASDAKAAPAKDAKK
jgi:large subunit ribosomal protein L25